MFHDRQRHIHGHLPVCGGGDFRVDAFRKGGADFDLAALFDGEGCEFGEKGIWGAGGVFDVVQKHGPAAVDFEIEIAGIFFRF